MSSFGDTGMDIARGKSLNESKQRIYWDFKTKARPFKVENFSNMYNPERFNHMTVGDGMIDPNITIRHEEVMPRKAPGYGELRKRDTIDHDRKTRVIHDYTGTPIIKVDQEGGIFDQQLG